MIQLVNVVKNRLELNIAGSNLLLKTISLKRIIELTTHSAIFIFKDNNFSVCITVEFEEEIALRIAPHSLPYGIAVYYGSMGAMTTQHKEFALQVGKGIPTIANGHKNNNNNSNNINTMNDNINTRKSQALQPFNSASISQRYLLLRTSSLSWTQKSPSNLFNEALTVIGRLEIRTHSIASIMSVDSNQENNSVNIKLHDFRFLFNQREYNTEDDIHIFIGNQERRTKVDGMNMNTSSPGSICASSIATDAYVHGAGGINGMSGKSGLQRSSVSTMLDGNTGASGEHQSSHDNETRKDHKNLIATLLCHIRYNSKESLLTDSFVTNWAKETFILALDVLPFDTIDKTVKKYQRNYEEVIKDQFEMLNNGQLSTDSSVTPGTDRARGMGVGCLASDVYVVVVDGI